MAIRSTEIALPVLLLTVAYAVAGHEASKDEWPLKHQEQISKRPHFFQLSGRWGEIRVSNEVRCIISVPRGQPLAGNCR